jgi:predicted glycogen debranching enzyme
MILIERSEATSYETSSTLEWLETNGIGGYASGTVSGANTRRYHGSLIAAAQPPVGRVLLLSHLEEFVWIDGERYSLSSDQFPGVVDPSGYRHIVDFKLDPFPIWTFDVGGVRIERSLAMIHGENTTIIRWNVVGNATGVRLEVRPLVAMRDHHHLSNSDTTFAWDTSAGGEIEISSDRDPSRLFINADNTDVEATGHWYRNFEYAIERERGFDFREDLYQPFALSFELERSALLVASDKTWAGDAEALLKEEMRRRARVVAKAKVTDEFRRQLVLAADQFVVSRGSGSTIIAGYHWFSDWGRDTMIALPGLTLSIGRPETAKEILLEFSRHISQGMIPNRFPDEGETPDYNTVDASLWYIEAIRAYLQSTGDEEFVVGSLLDILEEMIEWHVRGTRYGIRVDTDGLLFAGEPGSQLTWMDAKYGDTSFTPRIGKPVEIQALWYNALMSMNEFSLLAGKNDQSRRYTEMATIAKESFNGQFWNEDLKCLYDVVNGREFDSSIRPNQIFAVSLKHSMLDSTRAESVVQTVKEHLYTPLGLRSLSPEDARFVGVYTGSPEKRDSAYHQGPVWGWLIGAFVEAYRNTHRQSETDAIVAAIREAFQRHLHESMVGQVSEIFDGDHPHRPRGCAAQAWSVAELLRLGI